MDKVVLIGAPNVGAPAPSVEVSAPPPRVSSSGGQVDRRAERTAWGDEQEPETRKTASGYPGRPSNRAPGGETVRGRLGGSLLLRIDARIAKGAAGGSQGGGCGHATHRLRGEAGETAEDWARKESRERISRPMPARGFPAQTWTDRIQARVRLLLRFRRGVLKGEDH